MPPSIPAAAHLRSLCICTNATTSRTLLRGFTTTSSRREIEIPPESPHFIPLPDLPQSSETKRSVVKGHLPVPREIFTKRANMAHKIQPNFVEDTVPYSKAELAGLPPKSDKEAWKRTIAESRRQALSQGIKSLWKRKRTRETRMKTRAEAKLAQHLADKRSPERLDDVYTRSTITQATLSTEVIRDPLYEVKQRESQQRTAAIHKAKSEARKDALQRLYVEAGHFILTEKELEATVEKIFSPTHFHEQGSGNSRAWWGAANVWEAQGRPLKLSQMFEQTMNSGEVTDNYGASGARRSDQKLKIVTNELTGGALAVTDVQRADELYKVEREKGQEQEQK